jgi:nucleoside-diphosphate-sugar epimerase
VEFQKGDLRNLDQIKKAVKGVDGIFHLAANRAVLRSVDDPLETDDVNVHGTLNLLVAARDAGVKRVVYTSSSSVYGESKQPLLKETDMPMPESPYAASKLSGEHYCRIFTRLYGLETVALRYFNVFGPRQNPESKYSAVIPIFIDCILRDASPEIHWDGKQSRDFSYVDNVVLGNILAMEVDEANGHVFNIACREEYSVFDIFNELKRLLEKPNVEPVFKPKRAGDIRRTFADISKAEKILGYTVMVRFKEGLRKTVEWFLEYSRLRNVAKSHGRTRKVAQVAVTSRNLLNATSRNLS